MGQDDEQAGVAAPLSELTRFKQAVLEPFAEVERIDRHSKMSVQDVIEKDLEIVKDVARIIVELPPTQVSVERLFSALKTIKLDLRSTLKENLLEAILFLKTNYYYL